MWKQQAASVGKGTIRHIFFVQILDIKIVMASQAVRYFAMLPPLTAMVVGFKKVAHTHTAKSPIA